MADRISQLIERLKREAGAQKKKAAALGLLFLVLIIVVVRLLVGGDAAPQSVKAATPPTPPASAPQVVTPKTQPAGAPTKRSGSAKASDDDDDSPHRIINMSGLPRTLARDPFRSTTWLEKLAQKDGQEAAGPSLFERLTAEWSDYQSQIVAKERLADQKLADLELQSTMIGPVNSAYISGRLVHEGDEIGGFSVVRIDARRVILSFSGVNRSLTVR